MTEHTHTQLRSKVIHHMQNLSETDKLELEQFLTSDLTKYIEKMSKNGTYADHVCLQNMCKALSCKIDVVHGDTPNISIGDGDSNIPTLVVGYIPEIEHYVSLQRLNR
ncbi:uncharacterized protein LOC132749433 [Ruditapes philippinarum]|nr:uncharacterized protein LOC132749433 [Ruditapes philippinarum]